MFALGDFVLQCCRAKFKIGFTQRATQGKGKRGGSRVIYYWAVTQDQLLMLLIYSKSERDDLTSDQLKILKKIVEEKYR